MSFKKKPLSHPTRPQYGRNKGFPAWLVFLLSIAFVFGAFYLWQGVQSFLATDGLGIREATQQARVIITSTAQQIATQEQRALVTPLPSATPIPECMDFRVNVPRAIVRQGPDTTTPQVTSYVENQVVCVLGMDVEDWYVIDLNPSTRRVELGYMFHNIIEAVNPTPTPSRTFTPLPTVTSVPTNTPSITPSPRPTNTPDPDATNTPSPTPTPTPTSSVQNA